MAEEDILKDRVLNLNESQVLELFQIIYNENLFALLSEENHNLGKTLLQHKFGVEVGDLKTMGLKFTIDEHLKIVSSALNISEKQTNFWRIVTRITYIMLAIERNPLIAADIEELKHVLK